MKHLDPAQFQRINELLRQARDLPVSARPALLDECCGDDPLVREQVERKLAVLEQFQDTDDFPGVRWLRTLEPGQQLDHFLLVEHLGAGGMGEVWRARDNKLEREVALKFLPPEFAADPQRVARFAQEGRALCALKHPNVLTIHDVGESDDWHFLVTELVEGETLRARLPERLSLPAAESTGGALYRRLSSLRKAATRDNSGDGASSQIVLQTEHDKAGSSASARNIQQTKPPQTGQSTVQPVEWQEAVLIAEQIAAALQVAHEAGIMHRDIKPENVMVQASGHVKVLDFGIARWVGAAAESGSLSAAGVQTKVGANPGTLRYMSPEQARGEPLDARTDIFSLGLVLWEMLAGRHPYGDCRGEDLLALLKSADEIPPINSVREKLPMALVRIVTRALRKDRAARYESAGELWRDLHELQVLIEAGRGERAERQMRAQNAEQLLTRYVVFHAADPQTRIPLGGLWSIGRFAALPRGPLERRLIRQSWLSGLWRVGRVVLAAALVTLAVAARLSVTETFAERVLRDGHTAAARQAVFSPDGKLLVSVGEDKQVIVWDFARRERLATLDAHQAEVVSVAFAPDGQRFATQSRDGLVIVWDAARREKITEWRDYPQAYGGLAFSPDGRLLAYSGDDGSRNNTRLRETARWEKVSTLRDDGGRSLLFSPNSRQLMTSGQRKTYDPMTGRQLAGALSDGNNWMTLSPDAARLAEINGAGEVLLYQLPRPGDLTQTKLLHRERAHDDHGRSVEFSPDGRLLASAAEHVVLWNAATMQREAVLKHSSIVWGVAFAPDGRWLVSTHGDGSILVWDVQQRDVAANFNEHGGPVRAVAFAHDGQRLATAGEDRSVIVWNAATGRKEAVLSGHESRLNGVAFSPDGQWLAAAEQGKTLKLWDVAQRQAQWQARDTEAPGYCAAISPDGRWAATTFGVYERATGRQVADLDPKVLHSMGHTYGLAFSADGRRLVCVTDNGHILLRETETWRLLAQQRVPELHLISVSFAPDGQTFVTGEDEGAVRLWRTEPLAQSAVLGQHKARIKAVAFSPDGAEVASASDDKTIALWDVGSRKLITHIGTHTAPVLAVAFSPDGQQLVAGGHDRSVRLYTRRRSLWGWRWE